MRSQLPTSAEVVSTDGDNQEDEHNDQQTTHPFATHRNMADWDRSMPYVLAGVRRAIAYDAVAERLNDYLYSVLFVWFQELLQ
jgi:hypothetical protein